MKVIPFLTGSKGSNSNQPCPYCELSVNKRKIDGSYSLVTDWKTYQSRHKNHEITGAHPGVVRAMETLVYGTFHKFVTPPSLHCLLSANSFIKIAKEPSRLKSTGPTNILRCRIINDIINSIVRPRNSRYQEVNLISQTLCKAKILGFDRQSS